MSDINIRKWIWASVIFWIFVGFCYWSSELSKKEEAYIESLNPEKKIQYLVGKTLNGKASTGKQAFRAFEVKKEEDGYVVYVDFNADEYLSADTMKSAIEKKISEVYMTLYKNNLNVKSARITAVFPTVDKYGNVSDEVFYRAELDRDEANKINWKESDGYLKMTIIPNVWKTIYVHSSLQ